MFTAPKDPKVRKIWQYNLRRLDKPLTQYSSVCERHFDPRFIVRDYVHIINGAEVRIPRGKPKLAEGAIPTLLPDLPGYLSKKLPKQRPTKGRRQSEPIFKTILPSPPPPPAKKKKQLQQELGDQAEDSCQDSRCDTPCFENADTTDTGNQTDKEAWPAPHTGSQTVKEARPAPHTGNQTVKEARPAPEPPLTIERLRKETVELPSPTWCLLGTRDPCRVVFATTVVRKVAPDSLDVTHPKLVSFSTSSDGPEIVAEAYFQGALCCKAIVTTLEEAKVILQDANATHMCKGAMTPSEFEECSRGITVQLLLKIGKNDEGTVFSLDCTRNVDAEGTACVPCKVLRKTLQSRKSRVLKQLMKECLDDGEPGSPQQQQMQESAVSSPAPEELRNGS